MSTINARINENIINARVTTSVVNISSGSSLISVSTTQPSIKAVTTVNRIRATLSGVFVQTADPLSLYKAKYTDFQSGSVSYQGRVKIDDTWLMVKVDLTSLPYLTTYANIGNNPLVLNIDDAWTNRLTLIYNSFEFITL